MVLSCFCHNHREFNPECFANYLIEKQNHTDSTLAKLDQWKAIGTIKGFFFKKIASSRGSLLEQDIERANISIHEVMNKHNGQMRALTVKKIQFIALAFLAVLASAFLLPAFYAFAASGLSILLIYRHLSALVTTLSTTAFIDDTREELRFYCPCRLQEEPLIYTKDEHEGALREIQKNQSR